MKINFSINQVMEIVTKRRTLLIYLAVSMFVFLIILGVYFILTPIFYTTDFVSQETTELNIEFDKKTLQELELKKETVKINEAGGKNPFLPF